MQQIEVGRWLFWSGVLVVVATIVVGAFAGQSLNPPFGTSVNFVPGLLLIALALFLIASVAPRPSPTPGAPHDPAESPSGTR
jgi:formate hydrogenlyase subunit 4